MKCARVCRSACQSLRLRLLLRREHAHMDSQEDRGAIDLNLIISSDQTSYWPDQITDLVIDFLCRVCAEHQIETS